MDMLWIPVVLALICVVESGPTDFHPQSGGSKVKIVMRCHYNENGTWQSQVGFKQHDDQRDNPHWLVDVNQTTQVCEGGQSTHETVIDLQAQGAENPIIKENVPNTNVANSAPQGCQVFPGIGCYKFHHIVATWRGAQDRCALEGGHLVIINSEQEREVVRKLFAEQNPVSCGSSSENQIHTGLMRTKEGKYVTIFNNPLEKTGFSTWYPGQPSSGAEEPCVSIMRETISLNCISCEKQVLAFICEIASGVINPIENNVVVTTRPTETVPPIKAPTTALPTTVPTTKVPSTLPPTTVAQIPPGYELFPGVGYYKFHHDVANWPTAQDRCAAEGGHLVIINSEAEREVVRTLYTVRNPNSRGSSNPDNLHTGLERTSNGKYVTIFGTPIEKTGFSTWRSGEPNGGARESCMSLIREGITLNDISCSAQILAFICEIGLGFTTVLPPTPSPKRTPPGYELFPGVGYYKFHHDVANWPTARDRCAAEGGHLVIINSEAEREVVRKLYTVRNPDSRGSSNPDNLHIGLERKTNGQHVTIFGIPIESTGFSTWRSGEPNGGAGESCMSIIREGITLNDISCSAQILAYICEIPL